MSEQEIQAVRAALVEGTQRGAIHVDVPWQGSVLRFEQTPLSWFLLDAPAAFSRSDLTEAGFRQWGYANRWRITTRELGVSP